MKFKTCFKCKKEFKKDSLRRGCACCKKQTVRVEKDSLNVKDNRNLYENLNDSQCGE